MRRRGLSYIRQGRVLLAAATFLLVVAGTLVAAFVPSERYEATSVVSIEPTGENAGTNLVEFLMPAVEARVDSQSLAREMAARLPATLARSGWDVQTSVDAGSGVMNITIASDNRDVPLAAANAYAQMLDDQLPRTDVLDAVVVDLAQNTVAVSSRSTILVAGFSLAVILAFLVAVSLRPTAGSSDPNGSAVARPWDDASDGTRALPRNASVPRARSARVPSPLPAGRKMRQ